LFLARNVLSIGQRCKKQDLTPELGAVEGEDGVEQNVRAVRTVLP
jgi:hypothetical protein